MENIDEDKIENLELENFEEFEEMDESEYEVGYKGFNNDMSCLNKKYTIGEYAVEKEAILCEKGIHYSLFPLHVFKFYSIFDAPIRMCKILAYKFLPHFDVKKVTTKIKILKELSLKDIVLETENFLKNFDDKHKIFTFRKFGFKTNMADHIAKEGMLLHTMCEKTVMINNSKRSICHSIYGKNENIISIKADNISVLSDCESSFCKVNTSSIGLIDGNSRHNIMLVNAGGIGIIDKESKGNVIISNGRFADVKASKDNWIIGIQYISSEKEKTIKDIQAVKVDGINIKENTFYNFEDGKFREVVYVGNERG